MAVFFSPLQTVTLYNVLNITFIAHFLKVNFNFLFHKIFPIHNTSSITAETPLHVALQVINQTSQQFNILNH